jgi:hypothetical protein
LSPSGLLWRVQPVMNQLWRLITVRYIKPCAIGIQVVSIAYTWFSWVIFWISQIPSNVPCLTKFAEIPFWVVRYNSNQAQQRSHPLYIDHKTSANRKSCICNTTRLGCLRCRSSISRMTSRFSSLSPLGLVVKSTVIHVRNFGMKAAIWNGKNVWYEMTKNKMLKRVLINEWIVQFACLWIIGQPFIFNSKSPACSAGYEGTGNYSCREAMPRRRFVKRNSSGIFANVVNAPQL